MKKIIIFGATGNVGSYVHKYACEYFKDRYEVIASGHRQTDFFAKQGQKYVSVDISKQEEFEKLLEKRMGASYRAPGTAEADESTEQAESDMDVRSGSGQVPAADAAASRLAESGKARTGSTEKKPLKEKLAQKEAEDAKAQQGVQEDDTELTVEDLD